MAPCKSCKKYQLTVGESVLVRVNGTWCKGELLSVFKDPLFGDTYSIMAAQRLVVATEENVHPDWVGTREAAESV